MRVELLLLTRLLLVEYLLVNVLILKGALGSIVRACRDGLLLKRKRLGSRHLASIGRGLGEVEGLSDGPLGDMVGRGQLLSATVAVLGPMVGASLPFGSLSGWLCSIVPQVCQECLHLGHTNGVIRISRALFSRLEDRMAISIRNNSISLYSLVAFEVATVAIEIPGYLHDG
jgi:hypothetical protein